MGGVGEARAFNCWPLTIYSVHTITDSSRYGNTSHLLLTSFHGLAFTHCRHNTISGRKITSAGFSAWYHLVLSVDTTQCYRWKSN
jgi:hypothetical protein